MNSIKKYLGSLGIATRTVVLALAVVFVSAGIAQATSTTISTNISTTGTLGVTGLSTLTGGFISVASSTAVAAFNASGLSTLTGGFISVGSSTAVAAFNVNGATTLSGTLGVTGLSTLTGGFIAVASSTAVAAFNVNGDTNLASTTATSMKVGQVGTRMTRVVSGYCVTTASAIAAALNVSSSTATFVECTPSGGNTALLSGPGDRVFVQATSSLPSFVVLQSASTTANNLISVELVNTSTSTLVASAQYAFNFWAFQ